MPLRSRCRRRFHSRRRCSSSLVVIVVDNHRRGCSPSSVFIALDAHSHWFSSLPCPSSALFILVGVHRRCRSSPSLIIVGAYGHCRCQCSSSVFTVSVLRWRSSSVFIIGAHRRCSLALVFVLAVVDRRLRSTRPLFNVVFVDRRRCSSHRCSSPMHVVAFTHRRRRSSPSFIAVAGHCRHRHRPAAETESLCSTFPE